MQHTHNTLQAEENSNALEIFQSTRFTNNLIKGRIAETIFEQLFRDAGCFTILSFGYEKILPELAHRQNDINIQETMEIIRRAPDFAVIENTSHMVYLIEVKYLKHPKAEYILKSATQIYESWKPAYLFLATPEGFFFDTAKNIVENNGAIQPFSHPRISVEAQQTHVALLNSFIE